MRPSHAFVLGLSLTACGPGEGTQLTDTRGHLAPLGSTSWASDGEKIFFVQVDSGDIQTPQAIKVIDVETMNEGEIISHETATGIEWLGFPARSPDGETLYVGEWASPDPQDRPSRIFAVGIDGSSLEVVVEGDFGELTYAVSPDGRVLAHTLSRGTIGLFDLEDEVALGVEIGADRVLRFSPDGTRLLVSIDNKLTVVSTEDGTPDSAYTPLDIGARESPIAGIHWDRSMLKFYYVEKRDGFWQMSMADQSGQTHAITEGDALETTDFAIDTIAGAALSPDGTQATVWTASKCEGGSFIPASSCSSQMALILIDTASGDTSTIGAMPSGGEALEVQMEISPDARQLVYIGGHLPGLFVLDMP